MELYALECLKEYLHILIMGEIGLHLFVVVFDRILLILVGNDNIHLSLENNYMEGSGSATIK